MGVLKMYVSECAPNAIRGFSVSSITTMTLLGDLTLGFLALVNVFGNEQSWHFAALGYLIWTLIYLVLGSILPESPKFKRLKNAPISTIEKTVRRFHGKNANVHEVIEEYDMEIHLTNSGHTTFLALFKDPALRDSLLLAFVGALSSPLSPNLILMVSNIQLKMRFGMTNAFAVGLDTIAGFFAIPTALLVPFAIEKFGRRPIILLTISCNVVICILLFVAQLWIDLTGRANTFTMICSVVLSILDYITVSAGVGLFFIVIIADLLPASAKAATTQAAILANSFGTILTSLYFGGFEQRFGAAIHLPILLLQIFFLVFFARNLPETKQRPVYENYVQIKSRTNSVVSSRVRSRLHTASSVKKYGSLSENSVC
uniref:Major facilitator superfamily (MFS) profile domain-containing protein n=1 Tax=Panagrolaimus sp. JU765 TaxID=591449 RepID=A0AC34RK89_9BILA